MRVKLQPTHRFQSITFAGVTITKDEAREIPAESESAALNDLRLVVQEDPALEAAKPAGKRGKTHE